LSTLPGGSCRLYERFCGEARPARLLFLDVAGRLGYSLEREAVAVSWAGRDAPDPCPVLERLYGVVPGGRVVVYGPLAGAPRGQGLVMAPEGGVAPGYRYGVVAGDLDSALDPYMLSLHADVLLIHVHGDNFLSLASRLTPRPLQGLVGFTSQAYCWWPILGVGGFTDGDRLAVLSMVLGAGEIVLEGFQFDKPYCGHKRVCDEPLLQAKRVKLEASRWLLSRAAAAYGYVEEPVGEGIRFIRRAGR